MPDQYVKGLFAAWNPQESAGLRGGGSYRRGRRGLGGMYGTNLSEVGGLGGHIPHAPSFARFMGLTHGCNPAGVAFAGRPDFSGTREA